MILAACGGRGNGEKDAEGLARAESGEGSGKWEVGRVDRKEGLIKQVIVCRFVCQFVCLFICSAMGGQTARPNGLKFGG